MCLEIYQLDTAHFLSALTLAWYGAIKKTNVKLDILTDVDMLLIAEKGIRKRIYGFSYQYTKTKNKYMKLIWLGNVTKDSSK